MILGIDCGAHGALAVLDDDGSLRVVLDMPTVQVKVGGKNRTRIVDAELARLVREADVKVAVLEQVGPMPTDGSQQAFGLGLAYGLARMAVVAAGIPLVLVTPQMWRKAMKVGAGKDKSRELASYMWPTCSKLFARVADDGRADSALIAAWGLFHQNVRALDAVNTNQRGGVADHEARGPDH